MPLVSWRFPLRRGLPSWPDALFHSLENLSPWGTVTCFRSQGSLKAVDSLALQVDSFGGDGVIGV